MLNGADKIEGLTEDQLSAVNELAAGLASKNKELLGKAAIKDDNNASSLAEVEALRAFKTSAEKQAAEDAENWKEVERINNESHSKELEKLKNEGDSNQKLITTLLIDNGLSDQLDKVGINPALKAGAIAMLHGQCVITDGKAMIGDKSLSESIKEWSETDQGKAFTLAANNDGTGSNGGNQTPTAKKMSELSGAERTTLFHNDRTTFDRLAAEQEAEQIKV